MFSAEQWTLYNPDWLWIVIVGFIVAFVLAFGIGANDVANSFGSSVGAKVLTLKQACAKVSDTIRKGIISVDLFPNGTEPEFMMGNLAALSGSCIWMLVASFMKLPVSATHSIVGATLGFSLVSHGVRVMVCLPSSVRGHFNIIILLSLQNGPLKVLHFDKIPLYGTFIITFGAAAIVAMVVRFIIVPWQRQKITNPISLEPKFSSTPAKTKLPLGIHDSNVDDGVASVAQSKSNISMNSKSISMNSKSLLIKPEVHEKGASNFPVVENGVTNPVVNVSGSSVSIETDESFDISEDEKRELARNKIKETPETVSLFSFLQVLTAVFGSFAHGGNDVSNAIGPLVALWITATTGSAAQKAPVPIWILLLGGLGISLGLWILGRRVMKTLGEDLTKITPSSGFCIEVGSALTVLLASNIGIPVSTTHCKVGSIVFVGWFRSRDGVDWKLFRNIIIAWFVTLPIAGGLSAAFMAGLRELV
ncbi:S20AA-like protein [Mya arenaria]|uniref:Phosphate transporter n=1 Tax=Mya arenaria TaxID=6604 RepID=A0ABY7F8U5_MYAAR|nr:S20AA-like protein [Mya arenaria]